MHKFLIRQELPYLKFTLLYIIIFLGARVDHGHHAGKAVRAVNDAVALAKAVDKAVSMVDKGALIFFIRSIKIYFNVMCTP